MGLNLGALGSFAGGLAGGIERGQTLDMRRQDQAWQTEARGRQRKQWSQQDEELRAEQEARQAAIDALDQDRKAYEAQWKAQPQGPTLDGGPVATNAMQPYKPSRQAILKAAQARTDALFGMGKTDRAVAQWVKDEALRSQVRGEAAQKLSAALGTGADISGPLGEFYDTLDNGQDIAGVQVSKGEDGQPVYRIQHVDRATGKVAAEVQMTPQQLMENVSQIAASPAEAAKLALRMKLATFEGQVRAGTERVKGEEDRKTAKERHGYTMEEIGQRGENTAEAARIRVGGTITAAKLRASAGGGKGAASGASEWYAPRDLGDGRMVSVHKRTGEARIVTDNDGRPLTPLAWEKLVGSTATTVGKTIEGSLATPEANRTRARQMLPRPPEPAKLPPGLPPGSKQIGTSGGKPVFQTPDGKRFIAE